MSLRIVRANSHDKLVLKNQLVGQRTGIITKNNSVVGYIFFYKKICGGVGDRWVYISHINPTS